MAREIVEASVFWAGDLFAVKYFALGERVVFDDVPKTEAVEVRTRVVEAAPKMPRNRWDLPLGAIAITAACLNAMVVGSLAHDTPAFGGHTDIVHSSDDLLVPAEDPPLAAAAVGIGIVPVLHPSDESDDVVETPKIIDTFGDTGMVAMLAQFRGDDRIAAPWAPSPNDSSGALWGDRVGDAWGVGGIGLSGIGQGGGGNGLGSYVIDRVHTEHIDPLGHGHGQLIGGHTTGIGCTLHLVEPISCFRIPPEVIQRVVRDNVGRFRACYLEGLKRDAKLAGRVVTKFVIARDGTVAAASDGGSDIGDAGVVSCVTRAFMSLEFPANPDGVATVTYPIVMSPAE